MKKGADVEAGKKLYTRLKNKHIFTPDINGELYYVSDNLKYIGFWTSDRDWFQEKLNETLRKAIKDGELIPVGNDDFDKLKQVVLMGGGQIIGEALKGEIEKLKQIK